ncbi:MAG: AAA family ATPase [Pyrinomonadaceae bacterium]
MEHLLEILKIIEGSLNADAGKVCAYVEQLAHKVETKGDRSAAERLRRSVNQSKARKLSLHRISPNGRVPVDSESRFSLADEETYERSSSKVFLSAGTSKAVEEFIRYIKSADKLIAQGVGISPSLLIYGPPGCGKTELGRYIAAQLELPLINARIDSLVSSYLGSTAKNLRMLFEHAMARPCVLFLDEFDAVAKLRDDKQELGELKRVVVSLLQNIDNLDAHTVLLAATNHEHLLDPAVWRRFAYKVHLPKPDAQIREKLFGHFLGSFACEADISSFVAISDGLTGSDIRQVCFDSAREAVLEGQAQIPRATVINKLLRLRFTPEQFSQLSLGERIRSVRELDPKLFTYRTLADVFGVSLGSIKDRLKT